MKALNRFLIVSWMSLFLVLTTSCELVGGIFKAGMWWGIILVVGGIFLAIYIIAKLFGGKKS